MMCIIIDRCTSRVKKVSDREKERGREREQEGGRERERWREGERERMCV